jgi:hypothetical protein
MREVGNPQPVQAVGCEVAIDEVRCALVGRVGPGGAPWLAATLGALDALAAHGPLDAVAADDDALAPERQPQVAIAVGVVVDRVNMLDLIQQPLVLHHPA